MDDEGPLSPKANAFSIASLISVAAAFDAQSGGPELRERSPFSMHYSAVTREMEGKMLRADARRAAVGDTPLSFSWCCYVSLIRGANKPTRVSLRIVTIKDHL